MENYLQCREGKKKRFNGSFSQRKPDMISEDGIFFCVFNYPKTERKATKIKHQRKKKQHGHAVCFQVFFRSCLKRFFLSHEEYWLWIKQEEKSREQGVKEEGETVVLYLSLQWENTAQIIIICLRLIKCSWAKITEL